MLIFSKNNFMYTYHLNEQTINLNYYYIHLTENHS
jgi:hypothetical protein